MDRCGIVVDRCGSLWVVVGRCGSLWVVPGFSNYGRRTQSGYEIKVRELFGSIFRVIMIIFFLSVVHSNTCV